MRFKALKYSSVIALLFAASCDFGDMRSICMTIDGEVYTAENARIAVSQIGSESFHIFLSTKRPEVRIAWEADSKDPESWRGKIFRVKNLAASFDKLRLSHADSDVGMIIEITDIDGPFVSGKFSGWVGVGAGTHQISNGSFRAPATFWKR